VQGEEAEQLSRNRAALRRAVLVAFLVAGAVVLWGGYGRHWHWTGLGSDATLWDWLHMLLLPLAVAVAPLWARHRSELDLRRRFLVGAAAVAVVVLIVLGYTLDLTWTGFPGNALWDWLKLLVLPIAVAMFPVWQELSNGFRRRHKVVAAVGVTAFVVVAVGGYTLDWTWTGFEGNTLFDWLQLLVAPLALPLVLSPALKSWMVLEIVDEAVAPTAPEGVPAPASSS